MRKIIIIFISFILILVFWQVSGLYFKINDPLRTSERDTINYITENTVIENIETIDFYHGVESHFVVSGTNNEGKKLFAWVPSTLNTVTIKEINEGISKEDVIQFVETELNPKDIISIKLGMENSIPLYEIIYWDQQNRYSYYYLSFIDGTYLKHYHLTDN